jgi:hypothetical protein
VTSADANRLRLRPGAGHYESYFLRANDPGAPLAFWIRHTIFVPASAPAAALGELWAVVFDGTTGRHAVGKTEVPLAACGFDPERLGVDVAGAHLDDARAVGAVGEAADRIEWDLRFAGDAPPLLLLPAAMYEAGLPRAKALVPRPLVAFDGTLTAGGRRIDVRAWRGSQNHNWGSRHTDHYAWGQVAGFDEEPDAFLEVATAWLRFGPLWTPPMTPIVLRRGGRETRLDTLGRTVRARATLEGFHWRFESRNDTVAITGTMDAPREAFVGLRYRNPPGGEKHCLNTKIATCRLEVTERASGGRRTTLTSRHGAAFEILTDDRTHGVAIRA